MADDDLFNALKTAFPDANEETLRNEVAFFSTPFSIEPENLAAGDREEQLRNLNLIESSLRQALEAHRSLHPKVRNAFDRQFRESLDYGKSVAPGAIGKSPTHFYQMIAVSLWAVTGHYPSKSNLPAIKPSTHAASAEVAELVQVTGQSGGSRQTLDRVALVDHVLSVWKKYTGVQPPAYGNKFLSLLAAYIDEFQDEWLPADLDAKKAVDTYMTQKKTSLKGATKN